MTVRVLIRVDRKIAVDSLEHDDSDCIIEYTLPEDDAVQLRIDFESVEDGKLKVEASMLCLSHVKRVRSPYDGDRICRTQGTPKDEALDD